MPTVPHPYQPVGPVLVRTSTYDLDSPTLPDSEAALDGLAWLGAQWAQPELRDAITVASPDLAARVDQLLTVEKPDARAVHRAVTATASYLRRWQRRATPFGLFAGVTTATVGPAMAKVGDQHQAIARVDADWLTQVVDRLEQDHGLRRTVMVVANNDGFVRDGRFIVAARPTPGQRRPGPMRETSTRYTGPVRMALAHAAAAVRFDHLISQLAAQLPQVGPGTIETMLHGLIDGQMLITNLRPPMTAEDPLAYVLATLRAADTEHLPEVVALIDNLGDIHEHLTRHNATDDRRRQATIRSTAAEAMAAIVPAGEPPLAVDVRLDATVGVPQRVLDEAAYAAGVLLRVTTQPFGTHAWLDYHARFRARYGPGALVPVRDLVADSGLGYPPGYLGAPRARPAWRILTERDAYLMALIQRTMLDGADEIRLSDADIGALTVGDPTAVVPPPRIELGVSIHAASPEAMNRGEFELRITGAPRAHTSMAGRFAYLLDPDERDHLAQTYAANDVDAMVVQLSFPPRRVHNENVVRVGRLGAQVVAVAEHPDGDVISIDYLAVTADADQLYLVHRPTGRRVVVHNPHALAAVQMPPLARFLAEVGDARSAVFGPLDVGAAARTLPYTPRVRYRHTVLAPARWWLAAADLTAQPTDGDDEAWETALGRWRQRWRVPARVIVCHDELRLPLHLDDPLDRALLKTRLGRVDRLELCEDAPADGDGWLGRPAEFVIPMTLTKPVTRRLPVTAGVGRTHRPGGSVVVHARLIGNPARFDDLLTSHVPAFADSLTDLGVLRWWASRHRDMIRLDADQHLSLFFRLESPTAYGPVAARLGQFTDDLHALGLPAELVFASYHEQPGRYRNPPTDQIAEWVFAADTTAAIAQLRVAEQAGVSGQALAAASMVQLAAGFAPDPMTGYRTLLAHLKQHTEPADRALGQLARDLADPTAEFPRLRALPGGAAVLAAWQARQPALHAYYSALNAERDPAGVLRTLLHEHHVRAVGVDPEFERKTSRLARAAAMRCLATVSVQ
ncbi:lantibiotic dehydratase [Actinoplanes sp. NBRC 103695]|uniref:lantibiotic dehydratase n=1 Tax=Actinoplanes sp. NBRC 103695 TaxID=3032202 RepID=UPI00249FDAC7|nr:lantibiotic dehydratase [Actinoplanes sp. NBRC 103695]GLY98792.1 hypothetical protein Acsp02_60460 [Actinoplanes sp. NBRC 103695]